MCIIFALGSVILFWSSVITVRPEAIITKWEQNKEEVNQALAISMIARLNQSIAINPLDANSHLLLARYYEALTNTETNSETNQYTEFAEQSYKIAIKHQPSWDYAWAKLANFYSNQQPPNKINLMHASSKAMLLGPYERESQKVIIPLLFKHWPLITNNKLAQAQATKIIKHALKHHTHALLTLNSAKKYNQLTTLAPMLTKKWHKNRLKKYLREATND
ncbi:MAG TPA: hypothetical protein DEO86_13240 [Colwellia sp.]|nr:hypothetical protein [Colwellia sp.]